MRRLVREAGLEDRVVIDSAGTGDWHVGHPPDERATAAARRRGTPLGGTARTVGPEDFQRFDLVLAMDESNRRELLRRAPDEQARTRVRMLREFDPESSARGDLEVPDPYYGAEGGFEEVLDLVEAACRGLLGELSARVR
jgi:protein-tyrosine phosphatase